MIEAWFETSHDPVKIIPVIVPSRDLSEIAESAGFESDELFSIEIPGGASRHTRIRVLVDVKDVPDLYSSAISVPVPAPTNNFSYPASALFRWRESSNAQSPLPKVLVWLKPPRPVFLYPTQEGAPLAASSRGVMSVEAVDCRYWWSRQRTVEYPVPTQTSMDERWVMTSAGDRIDITDVADDMVLTLVPGGEFIDLSGIIVGTNLSAAINEDRITNLSLQPDHSPAMQLDIALSAAGFMLVYNPAFDANYPYGRFTAIQIKDERSALAAWMTQDYGKRACAAGLEPTSAATTNLESLLDAWVGTTASQYHRVPERVEVLHRLGFVEGQTDYANAPNHFPIASNSWEPATQEGPGSAPVLATWSNSPELIRDLVNITTEQARKQGLSVIKVEGHSSKKVLGPIDDEIIDILGDEVDIALLRAHGAPTYEQLVDIAAYYYAEKKRLNKMFGEIDNETPSQHARSRSDSGPCWLEHNLSSVRSMPALLPCFKRRRRAGTCC